MKNIKLLSFLCLALCDVTLCYSQTANDKNTDGDQTKTHSVVRSIPYAFKSTDLQGNVEEAIQQGKQDDYGPIDQLMRAHKSDSEVILRLVEKYASDPDESVRSTVLEVVSFAPLSQTSLDILVKIIPDESLGREAVGILYDKVDESQVVNIGGERLKRALFKGAFNSRYMSQGYLLLSCYKLDEPTLDFLKRRRASLSKPDMEDERTSLDLAFSRMGDADATQRIIETFSGNEAPPILAFLRYLKFVTDKKILLASLELLRKTDTANKVSSTEDEKVIAFSRVCDEALVALSKRFGIPVNKVSHYQDLAPQFSTPESDQAYNLLKSKIEKLGSPDNK